MYLPTPAPALPTFLYAFTTAFLAATTILAASPPQDSPDYIYDPLNSTTHGLIFSPSRIVLKVDCPGCPIYDRSWHTAATSLIFDFTIHNNSSPHPSILLNNAPCYPPPPSLGWSGFTAHTACPVPWTTPFDAYVARPSSFHTTSLVGVVQPLAVNNTADEWNLTSVLFLTVAYGSAENNNTFQNFEGNVSAIEIFYRASTFAVESEGGERETRQQWELVYWQIVPFKLLYNRTVTPNPPSVAVPEGLRYKLLGYVPQPEACCGGGGCCEGVGGKVDDLLGWVHFLGAVVVLGIVGGVAAAGWWWRGREVREWKGWGEVRRWWDEKVMKKGGEDGENAPLLAGGQDEEG